MDQLHDTLDKLFTEADILQQTTEGFGFDDDEGPSEDQVRIALSVAKRVRREAVAAVRQLAALRDATPSR